MRAMLSLAEEVVPPPVLLCMCPMCSWVFCPILCCGRVQLASDLGAALGIAHADLVSLDAHKAANITARTCPAPAKRRW